MCCTKKFHIAHINSKTSTQVYLLEVQKNMDCEEVASQGNPTHLHASETCKCDTNQTAALQTSQENAYIIIFHAC